jgi:hypothetical protein
LTQRKLGPNSAPDAFGPAGDYAGTFGRCVIASSTIACGYS